MITTSPSALTATAADWPAWADLHGLQVGPSPDAHQPAVGPRLPLLGPESLVVRQLQRLSQVHVIVAAVVDPSRRLERELVLRDEVDLPDPDGVELQLPSDDVHGALYQERRLRPPCSPVRSLGRLVGQDRDELAGIGRYVVDPCPHPVCPSRYHHSGLGRVRTSLREYSRLQAEDLPVPPDRYLGVLVLPSAGGRG